MEVGNRDVADISLFEVHGSGCRAGGENGHATLPRGFVEIQGQPEANKMIPETGVAKSDAKSR
jgi:hypothetical protein